MSLHFVFMILLHSISDSMPRNSRFCAIWQDSKRFPRYANWVAPVNGDAFSVKCRLCQSNFSVKNMGVAALESHVKGKKHQSSVQSNSQVLIDTYVKPSSVAPVAEPLSVSTSDICPSSSVMEPKSVSTSDICPSSSVMEPKLISIQQNQKKFDNDLASKTVYAEIRWCLRQVVQHQSMSSCVDLDKMFQDMFPDSCIASQFSLSKDKASYVISYGLAPFFKTELLGQLKGQLFTTSYDEAFNNITKKNQCDVHISYFNTHVNKVCCRYLGSTFLGHSTASEIKNSLLDVHAPLDIPNNLVQLGMDGPNVNLAVFKEIDRLKTDKDPSLLDIGCCGLHVLHGAYKVGQAATSWNINRLLKSAHSLFKDSPAKRSDFLLANQLDDKSAHFPKPFCSHRWLENGPAIDRFLNILKYVQIYVRFEQGKPPSRRPSSDSFKHVQNVVKSDSTMNLCCAQLQFSRYVLGIVEPFLVKFQAGRPLVVFLYEELVKVVRTLLSSFVKDSVLAVIDLCSIDLDNTDNLKAMEKVDIGFGAKAKVQLLSPTDKLDFRVNARRFFVSLSKKLFERSPLKYRLTKALSAFSPTVITQSVSTAVKRLNTLLQILHDTNHVSASTADIAKRQFSELLQSKEFLSACSHFEFGHRLDSFYFDFVGSYYSELWSVLKIVLILSHGNARVESGFSINKDMLLPNLKNKTLEAYRLVYDAVKTCGGVRDVCITSEMRNSVRLARQRQVY